MLWRAHPPDQKENRAEPSFTTNQEYAQEEVCAILKTQLMIRASYHQLIGRDSVGEGIIRSLGGWGGRVLVILAFHGGGWGTIKREQYWK